MRPEQILHHFGFGDVPGVHKARALAVVAAVASLIRANSAVPADIGRALAVETTPKHGIKRIDRLLGNQHLHQELDVFYGRLARVVLDARPLLLVDWTKLDGGTHAALSAAVVHEGRAIPICNHVHPIKNLACPKLEAAFLDALATTILPPGCKPILVTDMGYRNPWFKKVLAAGWDFVGRVSSTQSYRPGGESCWVSTKTLHADAGRVPKDLGQVLLAKTNPCEGRLICVKRPPKGRKGSRKPDRKGIHAGSRGARAYRRRATMAAVLFTSLVDLSPEDVVRIYDTRMQIEETFRSAKSHRFGWAQSDARSGSANRISVLFLLISLGMLVQMLLGALVEYLGLHRQFQANTTASRRVLSLFRLGGMVLRRPALLKKLGSAWLSFAVRQAAFLGSLRAVGSGAG